MESDWEIERPAFIAGEVGEAAIWLILKGEEVNRAAMAEYLEKKRRECKRTRFSSTHFLRFPGFQPSAGILPASGYSGIRGGARRYIQPASAL